MRYVIVGTAGHIDHGKTSLVKAMTGIDTDRLPEEKRRGITVDLGFAHYRLSPQLVVSFVDVPGHEKLVKNMIAGACGIDMVLLVVAADEGVMPQTVEHLNICQILGITKGVVALNKIDKVDPDTLETAKEHLREFLAETALRDAPVVPVSARTGEGIEELKNAIATVAETCRRREGITPFRMPVDRVFKVKGFGTVVTGTVFSGQVRVKDTVEVLPLGRLCRVRNIQVRGEDVEKSEVGNRTALNLQGIEVHEVERGFVVAQPGIFKPTDTIDAWAFLLKDSPFSIKDMAPVRIHVATKEAVGRVKLLDTESLKAGDAAYVRVHLEEELVAVNGEPFVIRSYSPVYTIGGGVVLDALPDRGRIKRAELASRLARLRDADDVKRAELFIRWNPRGVSRDYLMHKLRDPLKIDDVIETLLASGRILSAGGLYFSKEAGERLLRQIEETVENFVKQRRYTTEVPYRELSHVLRLPEEVVRDLSSLSSKLEPTSGGVRLKGVSAAEDPFVGKVAALFERAGFTPPSIDEAFRTAGVPPEHRRQLLRYLLDRGVLVRVSMDLALHSKWFKKMLDMVNDYFKTHREMGVADFKNMLGVSRKYAIPYLEMLDRCGVTKRVGNRRVKR